MSKDAHAAMSQDHARVDAALREQLEAIEREETPERLLALARELQRLLRAKRR